MGVNSSCRSTAADPRLRARTTRAQWFCGRCPGERVSGSLEAMCRTAPGRASEHSRCSHSRHIGSKARSPSAMRRESRRGRRTDTGAVSSGSCGDRRVCRSGWRAAAFERAGPCACRASALNGSGGSRVGVDGERIPQPYGDVNHRARGTNGTWQARRLRDWVAQARRSPQGASRQRPVRTRAAGDRTSRLRGMERTGIAAHRRSRSQPVRCWSVGSGA